MTTSVTLWLLLAISDGSYNRGTVTKVGQFATAKDCEAVRSAILKAEKDNLKALCVQARLVAEAVK